MARSVEKNVERNWFSGAGRQEHSSVRSIDRLFPDVRARGRRLLRRIGCAGRRIKRPFSPARRQPNRRDERADQGDTEKWAVGLTHGRGSLHGGTIAKQQNKAKSGFLFFQLAQPFFGLCAHIFRRGSAKTRTALHRPIDRKDTEYVL